MLCNISFTLQDKMGLQWTIELREQPVTEYDETSWMQIRQLRDRIIKSGDFEPDGKGIDHLANIRRSTGHTDQRFESGAKPIVGISREQRTDKHQLHGGPNEGSTSDVVPGE